MIHVQLKRYQLVLWETADRGGAAPALQLDFDAVEEARAAFDNHRRAGHYLAGIMIEWHKTTSEWSLVDRFPQ
jgi:hypothetical protein